MFYRGLKIQPSICPAATDARYVRGVGIPAFGFTAINNTPILLHDHNEYIRVDTYLEGIKIYEKIIQNLATM